MPIQRTVTTMVRRRAPDYLNGKGQKYETKEWIYYKEELEGRNIFDLPIHMRHDHYEGFYTKRFLKAEMNPLTREYGNIQDASKMQLVYYIPWNKKTIDDIIVNSATTEKSSIKFIIKFSSNDSTELDITHEWQADRISVMNSLQHGNGKMSITFMLHPKVTFGIEKPNSTKPLEHRYQYRVVTLPKIR